MLVITPTTPTQHRHFRHRSSLPQNCALLQASKIAVRKSPLVILCHLINLTWSLMGSIDVVFLLFAKYCSLLLTRYELMSKLPCISGEPSSPLCHSR